MNFSERIFLAKQKKRRELYAKLLWFKVNVHDKGLLRRTFFEWRYSSIYLFSFSNQYIFKGYHILSVKEKRSYSDNMFVLVLSR